jgi:hypothetical protein
MVTLPAGSNLTAGPLPILQIGGRNAWFNAHLTFGHPGLPTRAHDVFASRTESEISLDA